MTYRFLGESSVRTGALTSGQVDVIEGVSGNDAALFKDNPDFTYQTALNTGTPYSLFLNVEWGQRRSLTFAKRWLQRLMSMPFSSLSIAGTHPRMGHHLAY